MLPKFPKEIIQRVETNEERWPDHRNVLTCACVCTGITFPSFFKQLVMEANGFEPLLSNFASDPDVTSRTKVLGAISYKGTIFLILSSVLMHYGTPINPKVSSCMLGGSSSGSAVAVAVDLLILLLLLIRLDARESQHHFVDVFPAVYLFCIVLGMCCFNLNRWNLEEQGALLLLMIFSSYLRFLHKRQYTLLAK